MLTREQQSAKIRAQLKEEITHPTVWYPMSKKQREQSINSKQVYEKEV